MKQSKGEKLINEFDDTAQNWGWQADQGYGSSVNAAKQAYNESKDALLKYVKSLENKINKQRKTIKKGIRLFHNSSGELIPENEMTELYGRE